MLTTLFLIAVATNAEGQTPPIIDGGVPGSYRISVNVNLVLVHATVRDHKGRFVSNLRQENFEVYEDGARQSIRLFGNEDIPVTAGLAVDHSGSMRRKLSDVTTAAVMFVQSSNPQDEVFVVNFNETVSLGLPEATPFSNNPQQLMRAIFRMRAEGETALYDAVAKTLEQLQAGSRDKKVALVISDGADNASRHTRAQVVEIARKSNALVYCIGIFNKDDPDANEGVLRRLARETGGEAFFPADPKELMLICRRIADEIRSQYTLGYVSSQASQPGSYRAIRVVSRGTDHRNLLVRARAGYLVAGPPQ